MVVRAGNQQAYREAAGDYARMLTFVEQPEPRGYGEALYRAAAFVGDRAVPAPGERSSLHQPAAAALRPAIGRGGPGGTVLGLGRAADAREHAPVLRRRRRLAASPASTGLYQIEHVLEKPTPTEAEQELVVPGLRAGPLPVPVRHARAHARR